MTILICQRVYEEMIAHLLAVYPEEGCGILAGDSEDVLCRHFPVENIHHSSTSYQMNPEQQVNAMLQIGDNPFAIYHSHPNHPAIPSPTDSRQATYPHPYLIISLTHPTQPTIRGYSIQKNQFAEHSIRIV